MLRQALGISTLFVLVGMPALAQVTADGTVGTVINGGGPYSITGGTQRLTTLFHSFLEFSPESTNVSFDLDSSQSAVDLVVGRVTGGSASLINGQLALTGGNNPDLFLINPNGITFGSGARLMLPGSFIPSTAESVLFEGRLAFSTTNPTSAPLLTMSTPVGLQMRAQPEPITVQGSGHALTAGIGISPITRVPSSSHLSVQPGNTLALVGGDLNLQGATLTAEQGHIDLGSLGGMGLVNLIPTTQGYRLDYSADQVFGNIQLAQRSLLDVSSVNAGSVQVQGRQVQFTDGSLVLSQNLGWLQGGTVHLQASDSIDMTGTTTDTTVRSGIRSESFNTGDGSSVRIVTPSLSLTQGAGVNNNAFNAGSTGNITVNATVFELSGSSSINPTGVTSLSTITAGSQTAGNISIVGERLLISGGGGLSSLSVGAGSGGHVTIRNAETTVTGDNFGGLYSNISGVTYGTGSAGGITLETQRLRLLEGGAVATTSFLIGRGGDLNINAAESILIRGRSQFNNSSINSAVLDPGPLIKASFGLPDILTADAGSVSVITPRLEITDDGNINVTNQGSGNGGSLAIATNTLYLDHRANVQAQTASGEGGNLSLQVQNGLVLRRGSFISATAGGAGNGGNVVINAPVIVGSENSDIIANALQGNGGNINITTQGIFGLKFRNQLTPENDITASSEFGVNGTVTISDFSLDPNSGIMELPEGLADSSDQVAQGCSANGGNSFIATGRGGVPVSPNEIISRDRTWSDTRDLSEFIGQSQDQKGQEQSHVLTEINTWYINPNGQVELVALDAVTSSPQTYATCSNLYEKLS